MKTNSVKVVVGSLALTTALSGVILTLPSSFADVIDQIEITVPVSCSMAGSGSHTKEISNGNTENNIGTTTIKTTCNDNSGYAIYAIGYTNDEYGNTVLTNSTLGSTHDIVTSSTITSGISSWAMKLATSGSSYLPIIAGSTSDTLKETGDPDFSDYTAVPEEYTKVAYFPTSTDIGTSATGSTLTTTYRAYISQTQPAGTYVGQVKYTLVHPSTEAAPMAPMKATDCPANSICYAPNAGDIAGTMVSTSTTNPTLTTISSKYPTAAKQTYAYNASGSGSTISSSTTSITLLAPNYTREGYGFAGWSTDFTATNSSTIYGPNETITIEAGSLATNGMILYPVWVASAGNLQGFSCASSDLTAATYDSTSGTISATLESLTALTDTRDGNVYTVARLADGQCWMVENLRLDSTTTIATTDTNNPLHDANNNVTLKIDYANNTIANHLAATNNSWCTDYSQACIDQTMLNTNNTNSSDTGLSASHNTSTNAVKWSSYGNYYNWYSATAGNGTYNKSSDNTDGDLCPTGWHLPYGDSGNSGTNIGNTAGGFYYLGNIMSATSNNAVSSVKWRAFPNNFIYSGYWSGSSAYERGVDGSYWSSSAENNYSAYSLYLNSSRVYPGTTYLRKQNSFSVRCVAGS